MSILYHSIFPKLTQSLSYVWHSIFEIIFLWFSQLFAAGWHENLASPLPQQLTSFKLFPVEMKYGLLQVILKGLATFLDIAISGRAVSISGRAVSICCCSQLSLLNRYRLGPGPGLWVGPGTLPPLGGPPRGSLVRGWSGLRCS